MDGQNLNLKCTTSKWSRLESTLYLPHFLKLEVWNKYCTRMLRINQLTCAQIFQIAGLYRSNWDIAIVL
jgi:hypothetical protein